MTHNPPRKPTALFVLLALILPAMAAFAAAPTRPAYQFLRSTEDWSVFRNAPDRGQDPFDAFKFVPLDAAGADWASFGGDVRVRSETWTGFNFGAPAGVSHDDTFFLSRLRAHGDLHLGDSLRFFAELKGDYASRRDLPGGVRTVDEDKFELQQLFVDVKFDLGDGASLTLRPGRQEYSLGVQRLVSCLPWANSLRTWDGLTAVLATKGWNVTAFEAAFVPIVRNGIGRADNDELLGGVYARQMNGGKPTGLELYVLRNDWNTPHTFNGTKGADRRWTLGLRKTAQPTPRTDYDVEIDYQLGSTGAGNVEAWSVASVAGWQAREDKSLRLWAGFDWASGDRGTGGDVQTFNQLYPLGHAYFGAIDMIGRQNIIDLSAGAGWKAAPKLTVNFQVHDFQADSTKDAIYNAGGGVVRAGGSYRSPAIGQEFDVTAAWNYNRHVVLEGGYGHFYAGAAIEQSGRSGDIDFAYVGSTVTF